MAQFEVITQNGKTLFLDENNEIHRGGEGRIILINGNSTQVAKIYHPGNQNINEARFNQLQKLNKQFFIKPLDLLFQKNKVVGFTMEYAGKDFFPLSSLFTKSFCQRNSIDGQFKIKIANQLIEAVKSAHLNGFIIGDLNQYNVLISSKGEIRLIDVDSYETPWQKHSGLLLDDIRDYYYQGQVSMNSDYFALSVLIFNMLTFIHPFKGIHDKYKSLAERMIQKLPVFSDDPLLTIPKCYEPIQNNDIQDEFIRHYMNGERFLFTMNGYNAIPLARKTVLAQKLEENNLIVQLISEDFAIMNVIFGLNHGFIKRNDRYIIFDTKNSGYLHKKMEIDRSEFDEIYPGNENLIGRKEDKLFHIKNKNEIIQIKNFRIPKDSFFQRLDNILIVTSKGQMFWLYLDEVLNASIKNKRTEIFTEAIQHHNGLLQNTGGVQRIFYNTGKDIASVKTLKNIKKAYQIANIGIVQYIENNTIINSFFRIDGLKIEYFDLKPEVPSEPAYMPVNKNSGFVIEQRDNKMMIRRSGDFEIVSEVHCEYISTQTSLYYTNSGIIAWENDKVYLINQKK
jgi:serine/threonine protein kinase